MKKYYVVLSQNGNSRGLIVLARDPNIAQNKAVRYARQETNDKSITVANVESVRYLGFYLNRRFFAVK